MNFKKKPTLLFEPTLPDIPEPTYQNRRSEGPYNLEEYMLYPINCNQFYDILFCMAHSGFLALGSNQGDRSRNLELAIALLEPQVRPTQTSPVYTTPPWGYLAQNEFLNQVIEVETALQPIQFLQVLKDIERRLGRTPTFRDGPRIIDLDILFYDDLVHNSPLLTIPHPHLQERAFVLVPLNDIAPDFLHPVLGKTIQDLLAELPAESLEGVRQAAIP